VQECTSPAQRQVGGPVTLSVSTREAPRVTYPSGTWRARDGGGRTLNLWTVPVR